MPDQIDKDELNAACERFMAYFLRGQLAELESLGASDIPYAERARSYLSRYDAYAASVEAGRPSPQKGRHLRSVG